MPEIRSTPPGAEEFKAPQQDGEALFGKGDLDNLDELFEGAESGKLLSDGRDIESKTTKPVKPEENN